MPITLTEPATDQNFEESAYLAANPDVAVAVRSGAVASGRVHFEHCGRHERRKLRRIDSLLTGRTNKMVKIAPLLRLELPHERHEGKYNFLTAELRRSTAIVDTTAVSSNSYDDFAHELIDEFRNGLILDCGAGKRDVYYENVVNMEIVDYETTDVLAVNEQLPFKSNSFDAVISSAVLEHVRDPFRCASEIIRVLKPGGKLLCCVPFLQPLHGYPHHYFNMTHQGLRSLFEGALVIDAQKVTPPIFPLWTMNWMVHSWSGGLNDAAREQFLSMPLREFLTDPWALMSQPWVTGLSEEKNFELASATLLFAHKPQS